MSKIQTFHVHHETEPNWGHVTQPFNEENFTFVATVRVASIDDVFERTNHIESDWTENEEVTKAPGATHFRSTSIGDVVVDESGVRYRCVARGWEVF